MDFLYWVVAISAIVATSCSKDDVPNVSAPQKSVKFSLENVISTRGWDGMISASKVQLNDCQVFFVGADGSLYIGKNSDGTADATQYFTSAPSGPVSFHFLPAAVQKVVVVGNYGSELNPANLNAISLKNMRSHSAGADDEPVLYSIVAPKRGASVRFASRQIRSRFSTTIRDSMSRMPLLRVALPMAQTRVRRVICLRTRLWCCSA